MKKGCIKIPRHTYENDWHIVGQIFQQFKPFHIGFDGVKDQWVFTGTCDGFDDVPEHPPAPEYLVTVKTTTEGMKTTSYSAGELQITFQRAEPPKDTSPGLLPLAIQILKDELKKDQSEGSYYYVWKANIAMAIKDHFRENIGTVTNLHETANAAAEIFLNNLINSK